MGCEPYPEPKFGVCETPEGLAVKPDEEERVVGASALGPTGSILKYQNVPLQDELRFS